MTNHVCALLAEPTLGQLIKQVISIVIIGAIFLLVCWTQLISVTKSTSWYVPHNT